jgi:UDP-N-acetylglucosamine--N-acetylmuramyl-(pentapeptide) pyrophosphoryl-undecaprenol N-acetylglucosamine transferase
VEALLLPLNLLVGFAQAARAIFALRPDVVLGMGGYTAFPGGMIASLLNRPLVMHEQNSVAGLTNRVLACLADRVLVAFPEVFRNAGDKPIPCRTVAEWVGNPVRADIAALSVEPSAPRSGLLRLLVIGGSLGASALNELVPKALALLPADQRPAVVHQSGRQHLDILRPTTPPPASRPSCATFIDDMAAAWRDADFAICRAGAITVAELAAGVPACWCPSPTRSTTTRRQRQVSQRVRAGWLMQQKDLDPQKLGDADRGLDRPTLGVMAAKARALAKPDAAARVAISARNWHGARSHEAQGPAHSLCRHRRRRHERHRRGAAQPGL